MEIATADSFDKYQDTFRLIEATVSFHAPTHPATPLLTARKGYTTTLIPNKYKAADPAPTPPADVFALVHYPAPVGNWRPISPRTRRIRTSRRALGAW